MIKKIKYWLLENRHTKQTVAKNTFWLAIGTIASRFIKAIIIIYAARKLGTANYGVFSYALSLAALFSTFADIGTGAILTREAARDPSTLEKNLAVSFAIKASVIFFSVILIIVVAPIFSTIKAANSLMPLAALLIAFDSLRDFSFSITRAKQKMEVEAGINIVTGTAITVFGLAAIWLTPTPLVLMAGYVLGSGLGFLVAAIMLSKYLKKFWSLLDWPSAKAMIITALPFALMGVLNALTVNTDAIMIGWLKGANDVGLYAAAQRPVLLIYMASALLAASSFPTLMKSIGKDEARVRTIFEKTMTASLLFALPVFVGGALLAPQIILFLFGASYVPASATFAALLFTVVLIFPAAIIINGTFAYNEQKIMLVALIVGGFGNVIFDYLLIRPFGILGSSFATIISQSLSYGYIWWHLKKINNFYTLRHLKRCVVALVVMAAAILFMNTLHVQVLINILVAGLIYLAALIILQEKTVLEIRSIFRLEVPPPEA